MYYCLHGDNDLWKHQHRPFTTWRTDARAEINELFFDLDQFLCQQFYSIAEGQGAVVGTGAKLYKFDTVPILIYC